MSPVPLVLLAAHPAVLDKLGELVLGGAWDKATGSRQRRAWRRRLARRATRHNRLSWGRGRVARWLGKDSTWALLRECAERREAPVAVTASLGVALVPKHFQIRKSRYTPDEVSLAAIEVLDGIFIGLIEELPTGKALTVVDARAEGRHGAVMERVSRIEAAVGADPEEEVRLRLVPPAARRSIESIRTADPATFRSLLAALTDETRTPAAVAELFCENPPTWAKSSEVAAVVVAEYALAHRAPSASLLAERAAEVSPTRRHRFLCLAAIDEVRKQQPATVPTRARELVSQVLAADPTDRMAQLLQASFDDALARLTAQIHEWAGIVEDPTLCLLVANAMRFLREGARATQLLETAIAKWPDNPVFGVVLAQTLQDGAGEPPQTERVAKLERALQQALSARDLWRQWRGPSWVAVESACRSAIMLHDSSKALALGTPHPRGEATASEATAPAVAALVCDLMLDTGDVDSARDLLAEVAVTPDTLLARARLTALTDADPAVVDHAFSEAFAAALLPQGKFDVQHAAAIHGATIPHLATVAAADPDAAALLGAHHDLAHDRCDDAIRRLRPIRQKKPVYAQLLASAYRRSGDVREAARTMHQAAAAFANPEFYADEAVLLADGGEADAAEEAAMRALANLPNDSPTRRRVRRLLVELSWRRGDYPASEEHARQILADEPDDSRVGWALCASLVNQRRLPEAHQCLVAYNLTPSKADEAGVWIHLMSVHHPSISWLTEAVALADQYADSEEVASAFIAATTLAPPTDSVSPETVTEIQRVLGDLMHRHAGTATWEVINTDDPDQLLARIAAVVSQGADEFAQAVLQVRTGSMPIGILASLAGKSYSEVLISGAGGCIPVQGARAVAADQLDAQAARDHRVVADVSAVITGSLIPELWPRVVAFFPSLLFTEAQREDALRARDSFARPYTATLGWDTAAKNVTWTDANDTFSSAARRRSQFAVDEILRQEVVPAPPSPLAPVPQDRLAWLTSVELAKAQSLPLLADDVILRGVARGEGLQAFSTLDILEILRSEGQISVREYEIADLLLRRHGYVDLPFGSEVIEALALDDGWAGGTAAFQFARPGPWTDPARSSAIFGSCLLSVMRENRSALPSWVACASVGRALLAGPSDVDEEVGSILAWVFTSFDVTPGEVAASISVVAGALQSLGNFDPVSATAASVCAMLRTRMDESTVGPMVTYLASGCEMPIRAAFTQALISR